MNDIKNFAFASGLTLRVIERAGDPWFVAKDVCDVLGLDVTDTRRTLDEDERTLAKAGQYPGLPNRGATIINESGLYSLILKSRKPEARAFKKWVTSVVLPAIRKDGAYVAGEEKVKTGEMSEDELIAKALQAVHAKAARLAIEKAQLESKLAQAAPAIEFHQEYVEAKESQTLTEVAKTLGFSPRSFTATLLGRGVLYRRSPKAPVLPAFR